MELIKYRIKNYKSIKDTGICNFHPNITILAGKNESGKSSIIEAIRDFDIKKQINEDSKPIGTEETPQIQLFFQLNKKLIKEIEDELGCKIAPNIKKYLLGNIIEITKNFDNEYCLDEFEHIVLEEEKLNYKNIITKVRTQIANLQKMELFKIYDFPILDDDGTVNNILELTSSLVDFMDIQAVSQTVELPEKIQKEKENIAKIIGEINGYFSSYYYPNDFIDDFTKILIDKIPSIVFFDEFNDKLIFEVPIEELNTKEVIVDFCKLADIDILRIQNETSKQDRMNYLSGKSAAISVQFKNDWLQDNIILDVKPDGDSLIFSIKEEKGENSPHSFRPNQRSKGFQWFLSFYIRLSAQDSKDKIILIDEPGLYLHAKAQEDVLKVLEKISEETANTKVIISTHSPYFIDMNYLDRINLVEKHENKGTIVEKVHKSADKETLTPIITKMGFDISKSNLINERNVLVEGISDYYYMQAMSNIIEPEFFENNITIIPSVGAKKIPQTASILLGWGLKFAIILDNDKEGRETLKDLKKLHLESQASFVHKDANKKIEDLFSEADFQKYLIKDGSSKEVQSREFYQSIKNNEELELSEETITNFKELFTQIKVILERG